MRSSSAPAEFCRMRSSRASVSRSTPNMAPPRIGRAARMVAVALAAIAAHPAASAQDARENAVERAVGAALRAGDFRQAAAILERMAKSGNAEAQYQLASLYRSGRGVAQDDALAFKWMQAAAEQGHVRAQFNLGTMYVAGRGAPRDDAKARAWLEKAAAGGYEEAGRFLGSLPSTPVAAPTQAPSAAAAAVAAPSVAPTRRLSGLPPTAAVTGRALILDAALRGQADAVRQLIKTPPGVAAMDDDGNTPLALAAAAG